MSGLSSSAEAVAPWAQISFVPAPAWVEVPSFDRNLPPKEGDHITYLAWERHLNLTAETSFHATAVRLETSLAVQHQSQWRLDVDPRFHRLKLHWLRIVRGAQSFDHLQRDRMRLIQRETQLEHLVIDGQWTLLVVLPDVRVGDIIEAGYSFEGSHPIRPGGCDVFFAVPPTLVVGSYRLRVEFDRARKDIDYLTSSDAPARTTEELADGQVRWTWNGSQTSPRKPEPNLPSTFFDYIWVQVSDLSDWRPFSTRLADIWAQQVDDAELGRFPGFARPPVVDETAVHQFVRFIQDDFRYLSVDLESAGWIPARPSIVAQRHYGDCKDLVWLATSVLRSWGIIARPVLVGTSLRERVSTLRPMAPLFNHVVLEIEIAGRKRWFDLTMRHQGGDFQSQPTPWFAWGLPIEPNATLSPQPEPRSRGLYAMRETISLDTRRGERSVVDIRVSAEGWNAEILRGTRSAQGADGFAKDRLAAIRRRYGKGERVGALQWRDDRARNVCEFAEAFEIPDACYPDESGQRALFDVPPNLLLENFAVPEEKPRRGPWDLPHRMEIRHEICIRSRSCGAGTGNRRRWVCPEFYATIEEPRDENAWKKIMRFELKADEVAVERINEFRLILERFLHATTWRVYLPPKVNRLEAAGAIGVLPPPAEGIDAYVAPVDATRFEDATQDAPSTGSPAVYHEQKSEWHAWRFAIPLVIVVLLASRHLFEFDSSGNVGSLLAPETNGPRQSDAPRFAVPAETLAQVPTGPAVKGPVYSATALDQPPVALYQATPIYPPEMLAMGIDGEVLLDFVVTDQGLPTRVNIVTQTNVAFGRSATLALLKWRFRPAMKDGQAVNAAMRVPISFHHDPNQSQKPLFEHRFQGVEKTGESLGKEPRPNP